MKTASVPIPKASHSRTLTLALVVLASALTPIAKAASDLWIRDDASDTGAEPNTLSAQYYLSDDIWIRRTADLNYDPHPFPAASPTWIPQPHEGPCYRDPKSSSPNYIYVRVRNRGSTASTGNEWLRVYWAKAATGLSWPTDWNDHLDNPCGGTPRLYGYEVTKPRKNAVGATPTERAEYLAAIQAIDAAPFEFPGSVSYWDKQNVIHQTALNSLAVPAGRRAHGTLRFLQWHREMISRYESLLKESNPKVTLLYWDWTTDPTPIIIGPVGFMGPSTGLIGAPFAGWGISRSKIPGAPGLVDCDPSSPGSQFFLSTANETGTIFANTTFSGFSTSLEGTAHNCSHCYIGGTTCSPATGARDPVFFMIHANNDRLWARWQRLNTDRFTPATAYDAIQNTSSVTNHFEPWAGAAGVSPWLNQIPGDPDGYQISKNGTNHSIVFPPVYDDVPLRVPVLQPGEACIVEIPFFPPRSVECGTFSDPQHLCTLARIETSTNTPFGMAVTETSNLGANVKNNNNIAWRNVTVSDCNIGPFFARIHRIGAQGEIIRNAGLKVAPIRIGFQEAREGFRSLFGFGRVRVRLEQNLFDAWVAGGAKAKGIERAGENELLILGADAFLDGIVLKPREFGRMDLALELNKGYQHPFGETFNLDVLQYDATQGQEAVGGQRYVLDFNRRQVVPTGGDWRDLDGGKVAPKGWTELTYSDERWNLGTGLLGYQRGDASTELVPDAQRPLTAYFRKTFELSDPTFLTSLAALVTVDDGLVLYLNGQEIARRNMPEGPLTHNTPALKPQTGLQAQACYTLDLSEHLKLLKPGANLLAAEVHTSRENIQGGIGFDLELAGNVPQAPFQTPIAQVLSPANGAVIRQGRDVKAAVQGFDADGDLAEVRLYFEGKLLARGPGSALEALLPRLPNGLHRVSVEAEDQVGNKTRMESVFQVVPNLFPAITTVLPMDGMEMMADEPFKTVVEATDEDGTIKEVRFFARDHEFFNSPRLPLGKTSQPPYEAIVQGLPPGGYMIWAEATDDQGAVGYGEPVHVILIGLGQPPVLTIRPGQQPGLIVVSWEVAAHVLERAPEITGPWSPLLNAKSPFTTKAANKAEYFRLAPEVHPH